MFKKYKGLSGPLRMLMRYIGHYKPLLVLVVACIAINVAAAVTGSYLFKPLVNDYILPGNLTGLSRMLLFMAGMYILGSLASYCYTRIMVRISQKTVYEIRRDLFAKLQKMPISYFDQHTHGEIMSHLTNDVDTVSEALNNSFTSMISGILTFVTIVIIMITLSPLLSILSLLFVVAMFFIVKNLGGRSRKYFIDQQMKIGALNGYIEEMISGQKVIKVFNREKKTIEGFEDRSSSLMESSVAAQTFGGAIMPSLGATATFNFVFSCVAGVIMAILGHINIGVLVSYLQFLRQVGQPIGILSTQMNPILAAAAGIDRIFAVLDAEPEIDEGGTKLVKEGDAACWQSGDERTPTEGRVVFDHVSFGYDEGVEVLKDISIEAMPGKKIAFVGSTGAGKTTMVNLLTRFYDVSGGSITYDGIDIRNIGKEDLRSILSIVLQDTHLFTGTVWENIRFGRPDATDEEVIQAAKQANAHYFITHLPQGYNTVITSDGGNLSQGQRQLLAIARAAVAQPTILIMDEATSSIDTRTEKLIEQGMDRLMEGRTVFIVAHRLSTVRNSDAIMVIEGGEIIEHGSHQELIDLGGRYYELYTQKVELS